MRTPHSSSDRWGWCLVLAALPVAALAGGSIADTVEDGVRYGRDIRPILSDRCFNCHGPDEAKRKAKLRLDERDSALAAREAGAAIVPGDPDASALWHRLSTHDLEERMPPSDSGRKALSEDERQLLRRWIGEGASYEPHWSFVAPVAPAIPIGVASSVTNPIDAFVGERLAAHHLQFAPEADRATLCRRVFLDLTGLPPTPDEVARFEADAAPDAVARLVRTLMQDEPYATRTAERLTTPWLDVARYADTIGIHTDAGRTAWPWRDWVIAAYRDNKPYDRFVIEQLAGDLLPEASTDEITASGFNRMHVVTDEGGAIDEEYLVEYAVDRVSTVGTAFMGLTLGCARCHDHKFDPITMNDFYSLIAFFNNIEEVGLYSQLSDPLRAYEPAMVLPDPARDGELLTVKAGIALLTAKRDAGGAGDERMARDFGTGVRNRAGVEWTLPDLVTATAESGATMTTQPDGSVLASGVLSHDDQYDLVLRTDATNLRALRLDALADASLPSGKVGRAENGNAILSAISVEAVSVADPSLRVEVPIMWAWADVEQPNDDFRIVNVLRSDDADRVWAVNAHMLPPGDRQAIFLAQEPFGFDGGTELHVQLEFKSPYTHHSFGRVRVAVSPVVDTALGEWPIAASNWAIIGPFKAEAGASPESLFERAFGPESATPINFAAKYDELAWRHPGPFADGEVARLGQGVGVEYLGRTMYSPTARELPISLGSDDGIDVYLNGQLVHANHVARGAAPDQDRATLSLRAGANTVVCKVTNTGGIAGFAYRSLPPTDILGTAEVAWLGLDEVGADSSAPLAPSLLTAWRTLHSPAYGDATATITTKQLREKELEGGRVQTMVMRERMEPRPTFVLKRGQYDHADETRPVGREVPAALGMLGERPRNRLGFAEWLTSADNPLLARVVVNRVWEMIFGRGIVETSEDFGYQGSWPSHSELLDWLAVAYRESGWNTQWLLETILTSRTYRQSSDRGSEGLEADPENRWLGSFPRRRLAAEQLRDQALFVSDLLVEQVGGPPVKPYQPEGLWREVAMPASNTRNFVRGEGEDLWRRSIYTYWKRASPPPTMLTFDAPIRESCTARRMPTSTPLQSLALWNDPQFVEAARGLAERVLNDRSATGDGPRIDAMWAIACCKVPTPTVRSAMLAALAHYRERFAAAPDDALRLLSVGDMPRDRAIEPAELAAWAMLANAVLSSDAAIVKD
ncbi:MAG: PSD1 and planctomycete cytochrome C domain-containing protein [Planctomycetota bacterium]|nr:PSD1 and planctomycete cytochrome C domain-containing protein [Planctomycetota bacterium]MDA1106111.1 PSD1 and planctomycete cytochrome C domain-containing protein [Planctomycetota bacterium]